MEGWKAFAIIMAAYVAIGGLTLLFVRGTMDFALRHDDTFWTEDE